LEGLCLQLVFFPLTGLLLSNITGTCSKAVALANMRGAELRNIDVTGYSGPFLTQTNAQVWVVNVK